MSFRYLLSVLLALGVGAVMQAQPINDDCESAIVLNDLDEFCQTYDGNDFTFQNINGNCSPAIASSNVWFTFTAVGSQLELEINTFDPWVQPYINLFSFDDPDDACGSLVNVNIPCDNSGVLDIDGLTPGDSYFIQLNFADEFGNDTLDMYELCINNIDAPFYADPCQPQQVLPGDCFTGTNAGAYFSTSFPPDCPWQENLVFFNTSLSPGQTILNIDMLPTGSDPISDDALIMLVQFPNGCDQAFTPIDYACGTGELPLSVNGLQSGEDYFIIIGTGDDISEGEFDLCLTEEGPDPCVINNECPDAYILSPVTGDPPVCHPDGCNINASPGAPAGGSCDLSNQTVWYQVLMDNQANGLNVTLTSPDLAFPNVVVMAGNDCNSLGILQGGCASSQSGTVFIVDLDVSTVPGNTVWIGVSDLQGTNGTFELCVSTNPFSSICNLANNLWERSSDNDETPVGGPYCPGEVVEFCYVIDQYDLNNSGCQWFQSIVPTFGNGWDPASFDGEGQPNVTQMVTGQYGGQWAWHASGEVHYNGNNSLLSVINTVNGTGICSIIEPNCPNTGLENPGNCSDTGTPMPGGWYAIKSGGNYCHTDGGDTDSEVDDAWGDGAPCTGIQGGWQVCWQLTAREHPDCLDDPSYTDCSVNVITFPDGETGDWANFACQGEFPTYFSATLNCAGIPEIMANDQEICTGQTTSIEITSDQDPLDYSWTVDAPPPIEGASDGTGKFIFQTLINNSDRAQIVTYTIKASNLGCPAEAEVQVTVWPGLETQGGGELGCAQGEFDLGDYIDVLTGSNDYSYAWSNGVFGQSNVVNPNSTTKYYVTVTDNVTGCENVDSVTITINDLFEVEIDGPTSFCQSEAPQILTAVPSGGAGSYIDYTWTVPGVGDVNTGDDPTYPASNPGQYRVVVLDQNGCPGVASFELEVFENPDPGIIVIPPGQPVCPGGNTIDIIAAPWYPQTGIPASPSDFDYEWDTPDDFIEAVDGLSFFETNVPGIYTVTVTDWNGCVSVGSIEVEGIEVPESNSATLQICHEADGVGEYDLEAIETIVNANSGLPVLWYEDIDLSIPIDNPEAYETEPDTVYAIVLNATCPSPATPIYLEFLPEVEAQPGQLTVCRELDSMGTFNLTELNDTINGNTDNPVGWFEDPEGTQQIFNTTTYHVDETTVYAIVAEAGCFSAPVPVELQLDNFIDAAESGLESCNEGQDRSTFDLTSANDVVNMNSGFNVTWFSDEQGETTINRPDSFVSRADTVYARVDDGTCVSDVVPVELSISYDLLADDAGITACARLDGTGRFDLTVINDSINGDDGVEIQWFEDEGAFTPIGNPADFESAPDTVYARAKFGRCISDMAAVRLSLENQVEGVPQSFDACDPGNGIGNFDLTEINTLINPGGDIIWYSDPGNTQIPDPTTYASAADTIYAVARENECVSTLIPVELTVSVNLDAFPTTLNACDPGNGVGTFDLTAANETINGNTGLDVIWYEDPDLNVEIDNPSDYQSPQTSIYAIVFDDGCRSLPVEVALTVSINLDAFPAALTTCDEGNDEGTFDLTTLDNIVDGGNGLDVYYFGDIDLTDSIADPSQYYGGDGMVYAIVRDGPCRSLPVEIDLSVEVLVDASAASLEACDEGDGIGSFDLTSIDAAVSGGVPNTMVQWFEDNALTVPIADPGNYVSSDATVFARVVEDNRCLSEPVEVDLNVEILLDAIPAEPTTCDEGGGQGTFDLTEYNAEVGAGQFEVIWYESINPDVQVADPTNFAGADGGTVYVQVTDGRCISEIIPLSLTVTNNLPAFEAELLSCDDGSGNGLFDLTNANETVSGGFGYMVEWYEDQDVTAEISNPSQYYGPAGTIYAITRDGACRSLPVAVELSLIDNIVAEPTSIELCDEGDGNATFNLSSLEDIINAGSGLTVEWYEDPDLLQTVGNTTAFVSAGTTLYAIVREGSCESDVVSVDISVNTVEALSTDLEACDEGFGQASFDLTSVSDVVDPTGMNTITWYTDEGLINEISNETDYESVSGTVYAVVTDGVCNSQTVPVGLEVTTDLDAFGADMTLCDEGSGMATFDLSEVSNTVNGGNGLDVFFYEDEQGNLPIANVSNWSAGTGPVYARVIDGNCRSPIVPVALTVAPNPVADAGPPAVLTCNEPEVTLTANSSSIGSEFDYTWITNDGNIVMGEQTLNPVVDAVGTYELTVVNTMTGCTSTSTVIVTEDVVLPIVDAGQDQELNCSVSEVRIGGNATEQGSQISYSWTRDGNPVSGANDRFLTTGEVGVYTLTVRNNETGCSATDEVEVIDNVDVLTDVVYTIDQPKCFGENNGCIIVESAQGGEAPFEYALNTPDYTSNNAFCGLSPGDYEVFVRDRNGCEISAIITLDEPDPLSIELGEDIVLEYGDTATITAVLNIPIEDVDRIEWDNDNIITTADPTVVRLHSLESERIVATVIDVDGCTAQDVVLMFIERNFDVYAPTAFSPDGDGNNDRWTLYGDPDEVVQIDLLRIYTRWGEQVFERSNIPIGDESYGWDGIFRGETMNPGVFGFYAEVTFVDGSKRFIQGDINLMD